MEQKRPSTSPGVRLSNLSIADQLTSLRVRRINNGNNDPGSTESVRELPWNASPIDVVRNNRLFSGDFKAEEFSAFAPPTPAMGADIHTPVLDSPTIPDYFQANQNGSTSMGDTHVRPPLPAVPQRSASTAFISSKYDQSTPTSNPVNGITSAPSHHKKSLSGELPHRPSIWQQVPGLDGEVTKPKTFTAPSPSTPPEQTSVASEVLVSTPPPFTTPPELKEGGRSRSYSRVKSMTNLARIEPVQPDFMVSAPGNVIMYGEHAVVHGKAAIAASLSLRSYLHVEHLSKNERCVQLFFPDVGLDHTWQIDDLPWDAFHTPEKKRKYFESIDSLDQELVETLEPHLSPITSKVNRAAAFAFLYLYLCLGSKHSPPAVFTLRSTLPIGAGLGSSASVSVCISAALQLQMGTLIRPSENLWEEENQRQLKRINDWAFVGEMCIHGNPSGVDNTVATGGKAVLFRRGDYSKPPEVRRLENFPELPLLLVNTNQARRTAELVANVHSLRLSHPTTASLLLDAIDNLTAEAMMLLDNKHFRPDDSHLFRLGELTRINHGLLVSLGVSHPKLERIRQLVDGTGIGWTKLTGAGGGGCAITILKPNLKQTELAVLEKDLEAENFTKYETTLGGDGVGVLWPAMTGRGEERVRVTREAFVSAIDHEAIERLVGVGSVGSGRLGWGFWREWLPEEA